MIPASRSRIPAAIATVIALAAYWGNRSHVVRGAPSLEVSLASVESVEREESGSFPKSALFSLPASGQTGAVGTADDPAIWVHPTDPRLSVIIGTNKDSNGGLHVFDLNGVQLQFVAGGKHNNVDVRYGFLLDGRRVDLISVCDRNNNQIDIYTIDPDTQQLTQVGLIQSGIEVYGYAMYHSRATDKFYGFVSSGDGIEQWEFIDAGGTVAGELVRAWNLDFLVEGMVTDDELGYLYLAQEDRGIFKYGAEPGASSSNRVTVDLVGSATQLVADVEGLTIYYRGDGLGDLIASSQGNDRFIVYRREENNDYLGTFEIAGGLFGSARDTDGIDVINMKLGPQYTLGLFVAQNSDEDFKMVRWEDIATSLGLAIHTTGYDVRRNACGEVASVSVSPPDATVEVGATFQFTAVARDAAGGAISDCAVNWSTSDEGVATVESTGLVTGVAAGQTADIIAASGAATGNAIVSVVPSANTPPVVEAGPNLASTEGTSVAILAMFDDLDATDLHTATIDWGDGSALQAGTVVEADRKITGLHIYVNDGAFTATVTVRDGRAGVAQDATAVIVGNVLPVANAGGPYTGVVGIPVQFSGSAIDPGADVLTYEWDFDYDGASFDVEASGRTLQHTYSAAGGHTAALRVRDDDGTSTVATVAVTVAGRPPVVLCFALESSATLGGVSVANEDIVAFDGTGFSILFDGSDVGLGRAAIDAFAVVGATEILLSFTESRSVAGVSGTVDDSDVVRFTATSLGTTTAGSFAMYFDASDVGLSSSSEGIDAVAIDAAGRIYLSTSGGFSVSGVSGADEDVFIMIPTQLGTTTTGAFSSSLLFDGSLPGVTGDLVAIDLP